MLIQIFGFYDLIQVLDEFRVVGISCALVKAFYGCEYTSLVKPIRTRFLQGKA